MASIVVFYFQVRYKADCEEFYGKILGNQNVVSSVQGVSKKQTEEIWKQMYPNEPYELDMSTQFADNVVEIPSGTPETTKYDLHSAVKRQSSFFYQVMKISKEIIWQKKANVNKYEA